MYEIETEDFYQDIAEEVEARLDTSGFSKHDNKPKPIRKNKATEMMKDELVGKIVTEFVALKTKMYAYKELDKKLEVLQRYKKVCNC